MFEIQIEESTVLQDAGVGFAAPLLLAAARSKFRGTSYGLVALVLSPHRREGFSFTIVYMYLCLKYCTVHVLVPTVLCTVHVTIFPGPDAIRCDALHCTREDRDVLGLRPWSDTCTLQVCVGFPVRDYHDCFSGQGGFLTCGSHIQCSETHYSP